MTVSGYDDTAICNIALNLIGVDPISGLDEETDTAATCARIYPITRDSLLSKHSWNFGNAERQLGRSAEVTPLNEWLYAYRLPSVLQAGPFTVFLDGSSRPDTDYEVIGDYVYTDAQSVIIHFRGPSDPSCWPAYFVELVTVALAAKLAKPVTDNSERAADLQKEAFGDPRLGDAGSLFSTAKRINAQSKPIQSLFRNGDPLSQTRF